MRASFWFLRSSIPDSIWASIFLSASSETDSSPTLASLSLIMFLWASIFLSISAIWRSYASFCLSSPASSALAPPICPCRSLTVWLQLNTRSLIFWMRSCRSAGAISEMRVRMEVLSLRSSSSCLA